ncbi:hypothetical protein ACA910_000534 [Epithemia clementina (nom. ined.)]
MLRASTALQPTLKAYNKSCRLAIVQRGGFLVESLPCCRFYSRSLPTHEYKVVTERKIPSYLERRKIAQDYNNRRAAYKREIKKLRKEYAAEIAAQKAADEAAKEKRRREAYRGKLERQRVRNIRSGQSALRQLELKNEQMVRFEDHLEKEQIKREARAKVFRGALQLAINELEKEAHYWISTHEEVEAAFSPEAEQLLWGRPHGVLGSPNPCPDAHFWQHVTHTNPMTRSYKSQRQYVLERFLDMIYDDANLDRRFWTPERVKKTTELEEKARLRADVEVVGRRELLKKQAQLIKMDYATEKGEVPKRKPPPNLKMLANRLALEEEGSKVLLEDPTKFFIFDERSMDGSLIDSEDPTSTGKYGGPTLGAPIGYRRIGKNQYTTYLGVKFEKEALTEKEKKQEEREARLMEAAVTGKNLDAKTAAEYAAEEKFLDQIPDVDYDSIQYHNSKEWEEGVDPHTEEGKAILAVPPPLRVTKADMEWVKEQLEIRAEFHERTLKLSLENQQVRTLSRMDYDINKIKEEFPDEELPDLAMQRKLLSVPPEELFTLAKIDDSYIDSPMNDDEIAEAASKLPSFSVAELKSILVRDRTFVPDEPRLF